MKNKTTQKATLKQFKAFQEEAEFWIEYFGVKTWNIFFLFEKLHEDSIAEVRWNKSPGVASIVLNTVQDDLSDYQLKKSAFHEVCHLLLYSMTEMGNYGYSSTIVEDKVHEVIRTLENSIFKEHYS